MEIKELQKTYHTPKTKTVRLDIMSVLCGSQDGPKYVGNSSTEQLDEVDLSESIW
ncbi:MAG: hypothetical protein MJZ06_09780 [Bacteroidaceae bacterium]|nr:hypothetical protein [Bacteroidaceae bacterium]